MKILIYILEWVLSFFVIGGMNYLMIKLFKKKFNPITATIFTFIVVGFFVFLTAPYLLSFPKPAAIYLPYLIVWFFYYLVRSNKEMSS